MYEDDLIHWITERERVRLNKEVLRLPPPWTTDPIVAKTRFCNVQREDDKVTRWIRTNWRTPNEYHPHLAFAMCLARVINWPPTLKLLGFPHTWGRRGFVAAMDLASAGGANKIWTAAYMVTGGFSKGGETKQEIIGRVLDDAYRRTPSIHEGMTLQEAYNVIHATKGLGTFLSAQVIADLKYTPLLAGASDWWTFCASGPGSTMGLNFLSGRHPKKSIPPKQFSDEVAGVREFVKGKTGMDLTAHDTQNCLCEFSKYVRIKYLNGHGKAGYNAKESHARPVIF
jgi:hypothetical protein